MILKKPNLKGVSVNLNAEICAEGKPESGLRPDKNEGQQAAGYVAED